MQYLFIDTNIYIQCCLLELEGDDNLTVLNDLEEILDKRDVKLLLPEVVELEFHKVLEKEVAKLKNKIGIHKKNINMDEGLSLKIKKDLIENLDDTIKSREQNTKEVKDKMHKIFGDKNKTVRIKMKNKHLTGAYKLFLGNKKPYKKEQKGEIQPDCVIIEALSEYFEKKRGYKLLLCSGNKEDFTENHNAESLVIHEDISKRFKHVKYYQNLLKLFKKEFQEKYSKIDLDTFQKYFKRLTIVESNNFIIAEKEMKKNEHENLVTDMDTIVKWINNESVICAEKSKELEE